MLHADAFWTLAATVLCMGVMLIRALWLGGEEPVGSASLFPRSDEGDDRSDGFNSPAAQASQLLDEVYALIPYVRVVLRARGVPRRAEEDVVQSVLIGAWQAITSGRYRPDPNASLRAWIAEIARRQAAKYRRWARPRRAEQLDSEETCYESPHGQPDELLEDGEDQQFVTEQLKSPDQKQAILIAHDLDGLAMADIARSHNVSLSTAYRWRADALESLRDLARRREKPS